MKLWWISWNQTGDDYRPVAWPPPAEVLAYWCTGYGVDEEAHPTYSVLVALVRAESADIATEIATKAWTPGVGAWRFRDLYLKDAPPGDRFPPPEWSLELGRWPWSRVDDRVANVTESGGRAP